MKNLEAFPGLSAYCLHADTSVYCGVTYFGGGNKVLITEAVMFGDPSKELSQLLRSFCMAGNGGGEREEGCSVQLANSSC